MRLKRAAGHLQKIVEMIEAGKPCAQQPRAVENTIENAKKALMHDHMGHCVKNRSKRPHLQGGLPMREFKTLARYL